MKIELLTPKELAGALKRNVSYVYAMRARGFSMPGNRGTLADALAWLTSHPQPRKGEPRGRVRARTGRRRA